MSNQNIKVVCCLAALVMLTPVITVASIANSNLKPTKVAIAPEASNSEQQGQQGQEGQQGQGEQISQNLENEYKAKCEARFNTIAKTLLKKEHHNLDFDGVTIKVLNKRTGDVYFKAYTTLLDTKVYGVFHINLGFAPENKTYQEISSLLDNVDSNKVTLTSYTPLSNVVPSKLCGEYYAEALGKVGLGDAEVIVATEFEQNCLGLKEGKILAVYQGKLYTVTSCTVSFGDQEDHVKDIVSKPDSQKSIMITNVEDLEPEATAQAESVSIKLNGKEIAILTKSTIKITNNFENCL